MGRGGQPPHGGEGELRHTLTLLTSKPAGVERAGHRLPLHAATKWLHGGRAVGRGAEALARLDLIAMAPP